jgi:SAM-dependent methyltransferase
VFYSSQGLSDRIGCLPPNSRAYQYRHGTAVQDWLNFADHYLRNQRASTHRSSLSLMQRLQHHLHTLPLSYSIRRYYVDEFMFRRTSSLLPGSLVLDLGGHKEAKRGTFDIHRYPLRVVTADLSERKRPDVQADAAHIPFPSNRFDAVITAELLEHVPDPRPVLAEVHRVLRPGGAHLITVPFLFHIHADPYDYGRYTDHFWRAALHDVGYRQIEIERQGLFYAVALNQWKQRVSRMPATTLGSRIARYALAVAFALAQYWTLRHERSAEVRNDPFTTSFTTGFGIIARKEYP